MGDAAMGPVRDMDPATLQRTRAADLPPVRYVHFQAFILNVRKSVSPSSLKRYKSWASQYGSKVSVSSRKLDSRMVGDEEKYGNSNDSNGKKGERGGGGGSKGFDFKHSKTLNW